MTDTETGTVREASAEFTGFGGVERCFFDDGRLVLFTASARGFKELHILDLERGEDLFDDSDLTLTALYYGGGQVYAASIDTVYDERRGSVFTLPTDSSKTITPFTVSDDLATIVCFTSDYSFITYRKGTDGVYEEIFRADNNAVYAKYKELVLTGDYFGVRKTEEYRQHCPIGYVEGGTLHCYTGLTDDILSEATPFGTVTIDITTGKTELGGLSPTVVPPPESYMTHN